MDIATVFYQYIISLVTQYSMTWSITCARVVSPPHAEKMWEESGVEDYVVSTKRSGKVRGGLEWAEKHWPCLSWGSFGCSKEIPSHPATLMGCKKQLYVFFFFSLLQLSCFFGFLCCLWWLSTAFRVLLHCDNSRVKYIYRFVYPN